MWPPSLLDDSTSRSSAAPPGSAARRASPIPTATTRRYAHCDVLVVGGGPAGLAAALAAGAQRRARDPRRRAGRARRHRCCRASRVEIDGEPARGLGRATRWRELAAHAGGAAAAAHHRLRLLRPQLPRPIERVGRSPGRASAGLIAAPAAMARPRQARSCSRPAPSSGPWSSPTTTGPASCWPRRVATYVNRYAVAPGRRAVIVTNNDSAYRAALALSEAGIAVAAIVDLRADPNGPLLDEAARPLRSRCCAGMRSSDTHGNGRVFAIDVAPMTVDGRAIAGGIAARSTAISSACPAAGTRPCISSRNRGGKLRYDDALAGFVPMERGRRQHAQRVRRAAPSRLPGCFAEGFAAGAAAAASAGFHRASARSRSAATDD